MLCLLAYSTNIYHSQDWVRGRLPAKTPPSYMWVSGTQIFVLGPILHREYMCRIGSREAGFQTRHFLLDTSVPRIDNTCFKHRSPVSCFKNELLGMLIWCSGLSLSTLPASIWLLIQLPVTLLPIQLHANAFEKAEEDGCSAGAPVPVWDTRSTSWLQILSWTNPGHCGHL